MSRLRREILQIFSKSYKTILFDLYRFVGFLRPGRTPKLSRI